MICKKIIDFKGTSSLGTGKENTSECPKFFLNPSELPSRWNYLS